MLAAAAEAFAAGGYAGTSTELIAARAGISQPYLFRLFTGKRALFLAAAEECADRLVAAVAAHAGRRPPAGDLAERTALLLGLQLVAAAPADEVLADAARRHLRRVAAAAGRDGAPAVEVVAELLGAAAASCLGATSLADLLGRDGPGRTADPVDSGL